MRKDRRTFVFSGLVGCATLVWGNLFFQSFLSSRRNETDLFLGPISDRKNSKYFMGVIDFEKMTLDHIQVPFRGHSIIQDSHQRGHAVMFAQKPGRNSCLVDIRHKKLLHVWNSTKGKSFYGHGVFSPDGRSLFSTETDVETGDGRITVRDTKNFDYIGEFPSGGKDPHELRLSPDGKTLIIANGGLGGDLHDFHGKPYFNNNHIDSSLCFVDLKTGMLIKKFRLSNPQQSIRHLCVFNNGDVALGMQLVVRSDGQSFTNKALCGFLGNNQAAIAEAEDEKGLFHEWGDHVLSVNGIAEKSIMAMTHPFGDSVSFWNSSTGKLIRAADVPGGPGGLAMTSDGKYFVITASSGSTHLLSTQLSERAVEVGELSTPFSWDAHLSHGVLSV
jgi:hypothetical protein